MPRSSPNQTCVININVGNDGTVTVSPPSARPTGPNCTMIFNLTGNASWLSPYISGLDGNPLPNPPFGAPALGTNGKVTISNANSDSNDWHYLIHYNLGNNPGNSTPPPPLRQLLTFDPDIQNSNEN